MTDKSGNIIVQSSAELRAILQRAGIARAAADRIAKGGWAALAKTSPEIDPEEDLKMSIQALRERRAAKSADLHKLINKADYNDARDRPAYDRMMAEIDEIDQEVKRYQAANERIAGLAPIVSAAARGNDEHSRAFTEFLRAPGNADVRQRLADMEILNVASGTTDPAGGFLIPESVMDPLYLRIANENPFRNMVRVEKVQSRDVLFALSNGNASSGWVGETAARTATTEPTVTGVRPTFGTLYSYVEATEELMMDSKFDISRWFALEVGQAHGVQEMSAVISGTGTDKPTGLLSRAPTTGADGTRAQGVLKYLPTGNASTLGAAPSDLLISTIYDLKAGYRARASWVMNSQVAGQIRQLKDSQGRFLWTDGITQGEPATLLGYPVYIAESMQGVGANNFPIMFGDWERAYVMCEIGEFRITVDNNITKPGSVKFYLRRRLGGDVYDNDAVRAIKVAVT